jgi:hypothetical protein
LSAAAADHFLGIADGAPVLESRELPDDRILAAALDAFARWRQWRPPGGHEVSVTIRAFDEQQARQFVEENPDQFRDEQHTTDEARAREVRKNVILDLHERVSVDVFELAAAVWVPVAVTEQLREL